MRSELLPGNQVRLLAEGYRQPQITSEISACLDMANLPVRRDAAILLKPNLNNDLLALTGNSTDLRVLVALVRALQERGYTNITLADGPNIGTYRKGVDILGRLGVRTLAARFGVHVLDLNQAPAVEVEVETGRVRVAEVCLQADFFISIPKIKTHAEAGMSAAVKNLMGCVSGTDKRLMHRDLPANLVRLSEQIWPDWVLVDGLVAMEGNGPGDGTPRRLDLLLCGTDPFRLDLLLARLVGLDYVAIPYLAIARQRGHISDEDIRLVEQISPVAVLKPAPPRGLVTRILDHRALAVVRDLTRPLHGSEAARTMLYRLGVIQDVYRQADAAIQELNLDRGRCDGCGACVAVCPMELPVLEADFGFLNAPDCLGCLYCALVCPREAIAIRGELGYLHDHLARYGKSIRCLGMR
jgi:uncharacterized protein (DUF362 family)/ferredoxin